ncbi:hypothetical protein [Archangium sp.]|uniref:hypothetical protein n=1 Tax=Archangium sp. TaxID=1872627 RepID=UPI00389988D7
MRKLLPFFLAVLCACETEQPLQAPQILSISPTEQVSSEPQLVTVQLDTDPRFFVDYGKKSVQMLDQPVLQIGPQTVRLDTYLGHGQFQGTVLPGLEARLYDIKVTLGDGREAVLSNAYEVLTGAENPRFSYWMDTIGPQVPGQEFTITIHADGTNAELYRGSILVSTYNLTTLETTSTWRSGAFSGGVRQERVRIDTSGDKYLIVLEDVMGQKTFSNEFLVDRN